MPEQTPSKTHTWMLLLLVWTVILLMFGIGYMVYTRQQPAETISEADLANACANVITDRLEQMPVETPEECPVAENPQFAGASELPSFVYPLGWQFYVTGTRTASRVYGGTDPIRIYEATEGPMLPFMMNSSAVGIDANTDAYLAQIDGDETYTNITKTAQQLSNGKLTAIAGHAAGLYEGNFETLIFESTSKFVTVTFFDTDGTATAVNTDWKVIKDSMDFEAIE